MSTGRTGADGPATSGNEQRSASADAEQQLSAADSYGYLCGVALVLIGLVLYRRGLFPSAMFPVGAGLLGIFFRWRIAPVLVIGITGSCLVYAEQRPSAGYVDMQTWILCSALLAYVIGHYRLQSLTATIFPPDRRSPLPQATRGPTERPRSGRTMDGGEIGWLILALPFVPFAALLVLRSLGAIQAANARPNIDLSSPVWLTLVLLWILGTGVMMAHAALVYLSLHNLTLSESRIYLEDLLWLELRRDLRRLYRWRVWSRLRKDK
ncbi:MAG TPA: hypothetical protein VGP68_12390 [Gemmataceae bacterium]|jgi:hypothetical protein|nr:hypothetical protein [Gemmataceae bacterium]